MSINECNRLLSIYSNVGDQQTKFFDFVFDKISRDTKNRFVNKEHDTIDIIPFNSDAVKVIPVNKQIDIKHLDIKHELDRAKSIILDGGIPQVYLVYPKNENFEKHIQIRLKELEEAEVEYMIKVIPYSLGSILRTKKTCTSKCC